MKILSTGFDWRMPALVIAAGIALAGLQVAHAQSIPILNASFEDPPVPLGFVSQGGGIPGWAFLDDGFSTVGVAHLAFLPFGGQAGYIRGDTELLQDLGANFAPNTLYVLSVDCFVPPPASNFNTVSLSVSLTAAHLAVGSGLCPPQTFGNITLAFATSANDPSIGKRIGIDLKTDGVINPFMLLGPVYFDNVRLTAINNLTVSQGFSSFSLAQHEVMRPGVNHPPATRPYGSTFTIWHGWLCRRNASP
jgi:hypothetical protein